MATPETRLLRDRTDDVAVSRILYVLTSLNIPEILRQGHLTAVELSEMVAAEPGNLTRVLAVAVALGLLGKDDTGRYHLLPAGYELTAGSDSSLAHEFANNDFFMAWTHLLECVRSGVPAFEIAFGTDFYQWLALSGTSLQRFHGQMRSRIVASYRPLLELPVWPASGTCVDVAGGTGTFLLALLAQYTELQGVIFDRQEVVPLARQAVAESAASDRCSVAGGDAFAAVPPGHSAYIIAGFLHNLGDEDALRVLSVIRCNMAESARVMVVERAREDADQTLRSAVADVWMMAMLGGRERTEAEFGELGKASGLALARVHRHPETDMAVVEYHATDTATSAAWAPGP